MQLHKPFSFIAGDDWMLNVTLQDEENRPYDSQAVEIRWLLHNPSGEIVPHEAIISHVDAPNGKIKIWIPHAETGPFVGGTWTDWLRINCNGIVTTLMSGNIEVTADPWRAPEAIATRAATFAVGQSVGDVVVTLHRERIKRQRVTNGTVRAADTAANSDIEDTATARRMGVRDARAARWSA